MKTAIFIGSFDPMTIGHLDILYRISMLADKVIVLVGNNKSKKYLLNLDTRIKLINDIIKEQSIKNAKADALGVSVIDYVNTNCKNGVFLIKGLRNTNDFVYESDMAYMNNKLTNMSIETVYLQTNPKYIHISSSLVRELYLLNKDISEFVPNTVFSYLNK